jgi:hypothetical protein
VAWLPLQDPEAVQDVALVEDQLRLVESPVLITDGFALIVTVGAGVPPLDPPLDEPPEVEPPDVEPPELDPPLDEGCGG